LDNIDKGRPKCGGLRFFLDFGLCLHVSYASRTAKCSDKARMPYAF